MKKEIKLVPDLPMPGTSRDVKYAMSFTHPLHLFTSPRGFIEKRLVRSSQGRSQGENNVMSYIYTSTTAYHRP